MTSLTWLARIADVVNQRIGTVISWLALIMVLVQFMVVVMRYVFGIGSIFMQESIVYMHAIVFLVASGYTLLHEGHVRIDIFYSRANARQKAVVDLIGVFVFLLPMCVLVFATSYPYVAKSWRVLEVSQEGSGIPGVFLLKTVILVFAVLLFMQGLSVAVRCWARLSGAEPEPAMEDREAGL